MSGEILWPFPTAKQRHLVRDGVASVAGGTANGIYLLYGGGALLQSANAAAITVMRLDPVFYPPPRGHILQFIIHGRVITNDVAPGNVTFNFNLWAISSVAGASGSLPHVVVGSNQGGACQITNPGADSLNSISGAPTNFPNAGWYALGYQITGGPTAAGSDLQVMGRLETVFTSGDG